MIERISNPDWQEENDKIPTFKPEVLDEFVGQMQMKSNMEVFIKAASEREETLDHILLSGPPGLGKTTFAYIVAREMNAFIRATSAPVLERPGDMAYLLSSLKKKEILFIDEIHRLKPAVEEVLYSAMEEYTLDISLGQDSTSRSVKITLPPFTLIGATTKAGALTQPLLSRFGIVNQFQFYAVDELKQIVKRNADYLNIKIDDEGLKEIARRSRSTPRIVNRILRRVRDFAQVDKVNVITKQVADKALNKMHIDTKGLDSHDRRILTALVEKFNGGPVGLDNLATALGEDAATIEDMYEPYLIQIGFIKRTSRGRVAMPNLYTYLNIAYDKQNNFFDDHKSHMA